MIFLIMNLMSCSKGQSQIYIKKVNPAESLSEVIVELSNIQEKCEYYIPSLLYLVQDLPSSDSSRISITMIEGLEFLPMQMLKDLIGYFESGGRTILLMGENAKRLCSNPQEEKEFVYDEDFEVYPSDYSLWVYKLKGSKLVELESYKIPCN